MLELTGVNKTFNPGTINEKQALLDINLKMEDGDFVTVIGGNGAGKSTMLNAVAGVWPIDTGSIIIGGENYGQGSSREHAAINPMYLGVKCVIAKSIARIHKGNLVNHGIIPMLFEDPAAYDSIDQGDELRIENLLDQIPTRRVTVKDVTKHFAFTVKLDLTDSEIEVVLAGGQLRYLRKQLENM
jgi:aconitase A